MTKKDKKNQTILGHTKKYKKGFSNTVSQKKFSTKVAKRKLKKNSKKGFLNTASTIMTSSSLGTVTQCGSIIIGWSGDCMDWL